MGTKEKAIAQAERHCGKFWDENEWPDILEKYAEVSNLSRAELKKLTERQERGARITEADEADFYYYDRYREVFASWIANSELASKGYERDRNNNWILKNTPLAPSKKKFGLW